VLHQSVHMHSLALGGRLVRQTVEQYTSIIMAGAKAAVSLLLWTCGVITLEREMMMCTSSRARASERRSSSAPIFIYIRAAWLWCFCAVESEGRISLSALSCGPGICVKNKMALSFAKWNSPASSRESEREAKQKK
jgi:hypothetical protein